jgi:hypothetical protein
MTYASDITTFDDFVMPWAQLRVFAFAAMLVGLGIVAAALVIAAMSATCTIFASLTASPELGAGASASRRSTVLANSRLASPPMVVSPAAVEVPMTSPAPEGRGDAKPRSLVGTVTPRGAQPQPVTTTPGEVSGLGAVASRTVPLPPIVDVPRLVPLPPKRPLDASGTTIPSAEASLSSPLHANRDITPTVSGETRQRVVVAPEPAASAAPQDSRNPLQKFFSALTSSSVFAPSRTEDTNAVPSAGSRTALYDIQAHVVYLPNGDRLEAHSGLGSRFDDPRHVSEKNRGATPPHLYDLELRRDLFHGVAALRLNPVGSGNMFGRNGMLAHSYMLGPRGDSNGCVSFRDYPRFLRAFQSGEVTRLAVVPHLAAEPVSVASARH